MGRMGNNLWQIISTIGIAQEAGCDPAFPLPPPDKPKQEAFRELDYFPGLKPFFTLPPDYHAPLVGRHHLDPETVTIPLRRRGISLGAPIAQKHIDAKSGLHLFGTMQSHIFFIRHIDRIRQIVAIDPHKIAMDAGQRRIIDDLQDDRAIAVHVRQGDYLQNKGYYKILNANYFQRAVDEIRTRKPALKDAPVYVFSEPDPASKAFVREKLPDWQAVGGDKVFDWYALQQAQSVVISNSSFSYTATVLNPRKPLVIQPDAWYEPAARIDPVNFQYPEFVTIPASNGVIITDENLYRFRKRRARSLQSTGKIP